MTEQRCDVVIVGGGPVGLALACALQGNDLEVVLLEANLSPVNSDDPRALALSYGTRLVLQRLGAWQGIASVSEIKRIEVNQQNTTGMTLIRADEMHVPALGYVLPYAGLHAALQQRVSTTDIRCVYGATVTALQQNDDASQVSYQVQGQSHTLHARLTVVADGGQLLAQSHPPEVHEYGQSAIIAHVETSAGQPDLAHEFFTPQGPMALLPYRNGYELVLTASHAATEEMLQWDEARFLEYLQRHFGDRVGQFTQVGKRSCFPLRLKRAPAQTLPHTVLIGNAAQTLHPVAGQGFNMGLRDAWELAQTILDQPRENIGAPAMLQTYCASRRLDRDAGIRFTDGLVRLFALNLPLAAEVRSAALSLLNCIPPLRRFVAKRMMFGANG